jgi:hypothetical protein
MLKEVMNMPIEPGDSIRFQLPKSLKDVNLITWKYVISQLTEFMESLTDIMLAENQSLRNINARVDEWLEEQNN